ncbi:MAG: pseudouridine synthase [Phycisphaerales bacterium]|nr:pseudouridine synthase [Phycisphaerales bacterium]
MFSYFLFYKPFQVLSQFSPEGGKKTLANYFKNIAKDIYPVGRLDYDSEGLLLLTNDKKLSQRLLSPQNKHPRTYYVQVEGSANKTTIKKLEIGVEINVDGKLYQTLLAQAHLLNEVPNLPDRNPPIRFRKNIPTTWISLTLIEGKNRQVRKMTAAIGFPTLRLVRFKIGSITAENMLSGDYIEISQNEIAQLFS